MLSKEHRFSWILALLKRDLASHSLLSACFLIKKLTVCMWGLCMCFMYASTCLCMCMWRPEVRVAWLCVRACGGLPLLCIFWDEVSRQAWACHLARPVGSACFHDLASTGVTDHTIMSGFYVGIWGLNTVPMHSRQSPYWWSHLPSPPALVSLKMRPKSLLGQEVQVQANLFKESFPLKHPIPLC